MAPSSSAKPARTRCIDISAGDNVESCFLLGSLERRAKKNGEPYFFLTLRDCTGSINGVMWDNHTALVDGLINCEDFVLLEGHTSEYNGSLQMTVRRIERIDDENVDLNEFLAVSPRPRDEMEKELDELISRVQHRDCRRLLDRLFGHDRFRELFCTAPAAAQIHQAYIHGLLEHTLNVMRTALQMAETYQPCDLDLLITGGLLHDIGKIREFDWRRAISYTDEGRLVGHITIGANIVDQSIRTLERDPEGFSDFYRQHILHLILSHHGKLEYGSPVVPKTREALLLHYADYTDAYMTSYARCIEEAKSRGDSWTGYNRMFESYLFTGATNPSLQEDGNGSHSPAAVPPAGAVNRARANTGPGPGGANSPD